MLDSVTRFYPSLYLLFRDPWSGRERRERSAFFFFYAVEDGDQFGQISGSPPEPTEDEPRDTASLGRGLKADVKVP